MEEEPELVWIPAEKFFNKFVENQSGVLVSSMLPVNENLAQNADYYFENADVIAELKCLEKDSFGTGDLERFNRLVTKWETQGWLTGSDLIQHLFGERPLPIECRRDLVRLIRRSLEQTIEKARNQIRSTRSLLSKPASKSILFMINDGNYFLDHQQFFAIATEVLGTRFSNRAIDGLDAFVYCTLNVTAFDLEQERESLVWFTAYSPSAPDELSAWVDQLGANFWPFYESFTGQDHVEPTRVDGGSADARRVLKSLKIVRSKRK